MKRLTLTIATVLALTTTAFALSADLGETEVHEVGDPEPIWEIAPSLDNARSTTLLCVPPNLHIVTANEDDDVRMGGVFWTIGLPPGSKTTFYYGDDAFDRAVHAVEEEGGTLVEGPHDPADITTEWALSVSGCNL